MPVWVEGENCGGYDQHILLITYEIVNEYIKDFFQNSSFDQDGNLQ